MFFSVITENSNLGGGGGGGRFKKTKTIYRGDCLEREDAWTVCRFKRGGGGAFQER